MGSGQISTRLSNGAFEVKYEKPEPQETRKIRKSSEIQVVEGGKRQGVVSKQSVGV